MDPTLVVAAQVIRGDRQAPAAHSPALERLICSARQQQERDLQRIRQERIQQTEAMCTEMLQQARAETAALLARANQAIDERAAELEAQLQPLAVAVAEKIIQQQLALKPETIAAMIRAALSRVAHCAHIELHVNPADRQLAEQAVRAHAEGKPPSCTVLADDGISRGGAVIQTEIGELDARLETQLEMIRQALESGS